MLVFMVLDLEELWWFEECFLTGGVPPRFLLLLLRMIQMTAEMLRTSKVEAIKAMITTQRLGT